MKRITGLSVFFVFFLLFSFPKNLLAAGPSIQLFHPTPDASGTFTLYDTSVLNKRDWRFGLFLNYGHAPLEINNQVASEGLLTLDAVFTMGLMPWLEIGLDIPIALRQEAGTGFEDQMADSGLHDFSVFAKFKIFDQKKRKFGLAVVTRAFIPTGEDASFLGDDGGAYGALLVLDKEWKRITVILNTGVLLRPYENVFNNITVSHQFDFGLGAVYEILPDFVFVKTEISGSTQFGDFFSNSLTTPIQFYGGLDVLLRQGISLSMGGSAGLTDAYGTPDWRGVFGISYRPHSRGRFQSRQDRFHKKFTQGVAIHFPLNDANLQLDSYRILDRVFHYVKTRAHAQTLILEGHADGLGSEEINASLCQERAKAVQDYLIKRGIEAEKIKVKTAAVHEPEQGPHDHINMSHRKVVIRVEEI